MEGRKEGGIAGGRKIEEGGKLGGEERRKMEKEKRKKGREGGEGERREGRRERRERRGEEGRGRKGGEGERKGGGTYLNVFFIFQQGSFHYVP